MRHHVLVDSRDRDFDKFPNPNEYRVRLPRQYKNVVGARLLSADVPSSFFVFSAAHGNTAMTVTVGAATAEVTIPDGNYDMDSLPVELRAALEAAFPGKTFATSIDPRTMQLVVECDQGDAVGVDASAAADGPPTDWGLAYYLGFPRGVVTTGSPTLTSPGVVNLNPFTYVLLDLQELGTIDEGGVYGSAVGKGCFCKIPINGISYEYIFRDLDKAAEVVECRPMVPKLETLTVTWRLHDGTVMDFRGVEHSFLVEIITKDPPSNSYAGSLAGGFQVPALPPPPARKVREATVTPVALPPPRSGPPKVLILAAVAAALTGWWMWRRTR
jgi:hypothetical protein